MQKSFMPVIAVGALFNTSPCSSPGERVFTLFGTVHFSCFWGTEINQADMKMCH